MSDLNILGHALVEAGKAISAQSQSLPSPPRAPPYAGVEALSPKFESMNRKLAAVEATLSKQPEAIARVKQADLVFYLLFHSC